MHGGAGIDGHGRGPYRAVLDPALARHSSRSGSGGVGQVGTPGAALSGQIERYRQVAADLGVGDAGERPGSAAAAWIAAAVGPQLLVDRLEVLVVGLERLGIVDDLGGEVLVADPEPESQARRDRRGEPRLEPGPRVVGDPLGDDGAGLVVADLEQAVVLPHRVEPAGRHEHRGREPVEARELELVLRVLGG